MIIFALQNRIEAFLKMILIISYVSVIPGMQRWRTVILAILMLSVSWRILTPVPVILVKRKLKDFDSGPRYPYVKRKPKDFDSGPRYPYIKRKMRHFDSRLEAANKAGKKD